MVDTVASENQTVSNLHLLEVLERVEKMQVEFLTRMQSLETTVNDNTNSLNSVTEALEFCEQSSGRDDKQGELITEPGGITRKGELCAA